MNNIYDYNYFDANHSYIYELPQGTLSPVYRVELYTLVYTAVLMSITLVSNVIVVIILTIKGQRTYISTLLSLIAVCDMSVPITAFIQYIIIYLGVSNAECFKGQIIGNVIVSLHTMSKFLITFIALQRFAVCAFPFRGPKMFGYKTLIVYLTLVALFIVFDQFKEAIFVENSSLIVLTDETNTTFYLCYETYTIKFETIWSIKKISRYIWIIVAIGSWAVVTFCMIYCLYTLKWKRMKSNQTSKQKTNRATTAMISLIMLLFIVGELPSLIGMTMEMVGYYDSWMTSKEATELSNIILLISFLINIWIYIMMSKQFREDAKSVICCCTRRKISNTSIYKTEKLNKNVITVLDDLSTIKDIK